MIAHRSFAHAWRGRIPLAGAAMCSLLLGCAAGDSATGPEEDFVTPVALTKAWGDDQTVPVGQRVPEPLRVTVWTPTGHKCNGCTVNWTLSPGGFQGGVVATRTTVFGTVDFQVSSLAFPARYTVTARLDNGVSVGFTLTAQ